MRETMPKGNFHWEYNRAIKQAQILPMFPNLSISLFNESYNGQWCENMYNLNCMRIQDSPAHTNL